MPEANPDNTKQSPQAAKHAPPLVRQLWVFAKVTFGAALVLFGCWRLWVWAFGPDESLFFAYKVKAKGAAEQAEFWKQYSIKLRDLRKSDDNPVQASQQIEQLQRDLERETEQQAERDRSRYRGERWMEWFLIVFSFAMGPGLIGSGRGVLWGMRQGSA